jgi:hypothetical protein
MNDTVLTSPAPIQRPARTLANSADLRLSKPTRHTTKRDLNASNASIHIPSGTEVNTYFSEKNPSFIYVESPDGKLLATRAQNASITFTGKFTKAPSINTMMKWSDEGVARTITGHRTEPDGTGPDGSPSWLLVLGCI